MSTAREGKLTRNIPLYALLFHAVSPTYALDFSFEKNHCAAGEYRPKEPKSDGTSGLLNFTAWVETDICMKVPIANLQAAAADLGVMTWSGTTKIAGSKKLPITRPNDLFRVKVTYECPPHASLVPIGAMADDVVRPRDRRNESSAGSDLVDTNRVPSGDGNGVYIKQMSARIELLGDSGYAPTRPSK